MAEKVRKVELPADLPGYFPVPTALLGLDLVSVCERCSSLVLRIHQNRHDLWHASMSLHSHPAGAVVIHPNGCCCGGCP